jgi:hypothetical protein
LDPLSKKIFQYRFTTIFFTNYLHLSKLNQKSITLDE